jgi:hypothetical protein
LGIQPARVSIGFGTFTRRVRVWPEPEPFRHFLKSGGRVEILGLSAREGPVDFAASTSASGAAREITIGKLNPTVNVNLNVNLNTKFESVLLCLQNTVNQLGSSQRYKSSYCFRSP